MITPQHRRLSVRGHSVLYVAAFSGLLGAATHAAQVPATWIGPASSNWNSPSNWSSGSVPINGTPSGTSYAVFIDGDNAGNCTVLLDMNSQIDALTISSGDQLTLANNTQLQLVGGTWSNAGTVTIAAAANNTIFRIDSSPVSLSGGGTVVLSRSGGGNAFLFGTTTLTNVNNTIRGTGEIGNNSNAIANQSAGVMQADVSGAVLNLDPVNVSGAFSNAGILRATNGGILQFNGNGGGDFVNTGTIQAQTGSEVRLVNNASISGGTLTTVGDGTIDVRSGHTAFLAGVTNAGGLIVSNNAHLLLNGNLINNGSISINATVNNTEFFINGGSVSLSGTGSLLMNISGAGGAAFIDGGGTLVNGTVISGAGNLGNNGLFIINSSSITATNPSFALNLDPVNAGNTFVNNGTLLADGGVLVLNGFGGGAFDNTLGKIIAGPTDVQIQNSVSVSGGVLSSSGAGVVRVIGGHTGNIANLINSGNLTVDNGGILNSSGTLNNTGSINVNAAANNTVLNCLGTTLSGGGTMTLSRAGAGAAILSGSGTFTNLNNMIQGSGALGANNLAVVNQAAGVIQANVSGAVLDLDPVNVSGAFTNAGILRATNGGILQLNGFGGGDFVNAGTIQAQTGSEVRLVNNASITGGTLSATGTGTMDLLSGHTAFVSGVTTTGNFIIANNARLALNGNVVNEGSINLAATVNNTELFVNGGSVSITGIGEIDMSISGSGNALIDGSGTLVLGTPISGAGNIGCNTLFMINNSIIAATSAASGLTIDPVNNGTLATFTNNGTLMASGGVLVLNGFGGGTFDSTAGHIIAGPSDVQLVNSIGILGGVFSSSGAGIIRVPGGHTAGLSSITSAGNLTIDNNAQIDWAGTLNNNGSININATVNHTLLSLTNSGNAGTIAGSGVITMNMTGQGGTAFITGSGTMVSNNSISGAGNIGANNLAFINNSTITANNGSFSLAIDPVNVASPSFTNNGTLLANGGVLVLSGFGGGDFVNGANGRVIAGSSDVQLVNSATVTGGTFQSSGAGVFHVLGGHVAGLVNITNTGNITVDNNAQLNWAPTLTNNGSININATVNNALLNLTNSGAAGTLAGSGVVNLSTTAGGTAFVVGSGTLVTGNTIRGQGNIGNNVMSIVSSGLIDADVNAAALTIDPVNGGNLTNAGILQASNGGNLNLSGFGGGTFLSTSGGINVQTNSVLNTLNSAVLAAGTIQLEGTWNHSQSSSATVSNFRGAGTLNLSNGAFLQVNAGGGTQGTSRASALSITTSGKLDLTNHSMVIDYTGTSPLASVRQMIQSGFGSGNWNGTGLTSSQAATSPNPGEVAKTALGYAEASKVLGPGGGSFAGQLVDGTSILIKYTYAGDSNLDGQVDVTDLGALATSWQTSSIWTGGDFNYDGFVDVTDLGILATGWQAGVGSPLGPGSFEAALQAVGLGRLTVPEPAIGVAVSALALGGAFRRRRSQ